MVKRVAVVFGFLHTADVIFRRTFAFFQLLGTSLSEYVEVDIQVFQRFQNLDFANVMYLVYLVRVRRVWVLRQSWLNCPHAPQTG